MSEKVLAMDRKEISAFLIGCKPDELMSFKDYGDDGVAAIGPDGKKYVYDAAYLEQAITKKEAAEQAEKPAQPAKRKAPAKRAARPTKAGTGKPAARSSTKAKK
jgi:hypothetical protein